MKKFIYLALTLAMLAVLGLPGRWQLFAVQSGSMEPAIKTGSLVVLQKNPDYQAGEVITFQTGRVTVTHRINQVKNSLYQTKGDANQTVDTETVRQEQILGKVIFTLPYLGYPVSLVKTKEGFIGLIVIPATVIVYSEILKIKDEIKKRKKQHE